MPAQKTYKNAKGFAFVWVILLMFLLAGGVFFASKGKISVPTPKSPTKSLPVVPLSSITPAPADKKVSLLDFCKTEIQTLPKIPFTYEKLTPTGSNATLYRKDRIKDKKEFTDFATCGLDYIIYKTVEKTYADLGLQSHVTDKAGNRYWNPKAPVEKFAQAIDSKYGGIVLGQGWTRQTKVGGEYLSYGLPTLIYYKDMVDKNYYIDIVVGPSSASFEFMIVKK